MAFDMTRIYSNRSLFSMQRSAAKRRGIEFELTFEEWINWWLTNLGPDWKSLRGCKRGQYVMARKGDIGPYNLKNIQCVTVADNYHSRSKLLQPRKLTIDQVLIIRNTKLNAPSLAKEFNITRTYVHQIRRKYRWKNL